MGATHVVLMLPVGSCCLVAGFGLESSVELKIERGRPKFALTNLERYFQGLGYVGFADA